MKLFSGGSQIRVPGERAFEAMRGFASSRADTARLLTGEGAQIGAHTPSPF